MPNELQLVAGALALLIVRDLVDLPYRHKYQDVVAEYNKLVHAHNELVEDLNYLIHKINENEIVLDEFDLIVLNKVTAQKS